MPKILTLISWNVNGIRAAERKGFLDWLAAAKADIVCVQETKISYPEQISEALKNPPGYTSYWDYATEKKGYSGVAIYTKIPPRKVHTRFDDSLLSKEGRLIEMHFDDCVLFNIYFPNGGSGTIRLEYKLEFYRQFLAYITELKKKHKQIIFCGDINTAHTEIDLARPKENSNTSGFMPIERVWIDKYIDAGFVDTFRAKYPDTKEQYTWWDMKSYARARNVGWRIDYFFITKEMIPRLHDAFILPDVTGSDHCPVGIRITF